MLKWTHRLTQLHGAWVRAWWVRWNAKQALDGAQPGEIAAAGTAYAKALDAEASAFAAYQSELTYAAINARLRREEESGISGQADSDVAEMENMNALGLRSRHQR